MYSTKNGKGKKILSIKGCSGGMQVFLSGSRASQWMATAAAPAGLYHLTDGVKRRAVSFWKEDDRQNGVCSTRTFTYPLVVDVGGWKIMGGVDQKKNECRLRLERLAPQNGKESFEMIPAAAAAASSSAFCCRFLFFFEEWRGGRSC